MSTNSSQLILQTVARLNKASVTDIVKSLPEPRSRQWISTLLKQLAREGKLIRSQEGKYVYFVLPNKLELIGKRISRRLINKGLDEDIIYDEISSQTPFLSKINEDVRSIITYGFTEMLNNAIEHSQSKSIEVFIEERDNIISFEILDKGIGAFRNIMQKEKLHSELEAIQELLKGKTTTLPHSHTGEGIFFTSKISDMFILDSYEYRLRIDNLLPDTFIEKITAFLGTRVRFEIKKDSNKHLNNLFYQYQAEPGSFSFDKTKVLVKLFKAGSIYISRSQARRLMVNLDKYQNIVLDFEGIETVGQAFADEVFRVFAGKHPQIKIDPINMSEVVRFMVNRVQKPQLSLLSGNNT